MKPGWKGVAPIIHLVETTYQTGVKVLADELEHYKPFLLPSETLPKWYITILPFSWLSYLSASPLGKNENLNRAILVSDFSYLCCYQLQAP
ncbi:MAG: hypothetical protein O4804_14875 [Trichodesmium sp. St11_bin5]|nr:hypothetical protein [Trichodesmium sp. St11_bin5]MDT9339661.1 hypothetical protein [Trichodesmium erythraeum 21-75]